MMHHDRDSEYRALVQQLMDAGWYRVNEERGVAGVTCQFRQGHLLDAQHGNECTVVGIHAKDAMRKLLAALTAERGRGTS